jgi:UDP-glucose 4-epimerase
MAMSKKRVLCTGGAGYVGSACLRYLLKQGYEAFAYDNLSEGQRLAVPDADTRLIVGDISDRNKMAQTLRDYNIDAVMHFAAVASVPESIKQPSLYWAVNVTGTKNLLDAMLECGVKNIVFSSTAATYAFSDNMPLVEDDLKHPVTPYGTTKLACESMLNDYRIAYNMGFTAMRYFNASGADPDGEYGEDRNNECHLIPLVLYAAVGRRAEVKVFGEDWDTRDGSCVRDYIHVEDIARAHVLAMESQQPGIGRFYNIGSNSGATVKEIISACEKVSGKSIPWSSDLPRPGDPATLIANADKLVNELGWSPKYKTIEEIVETAYRWHSQYPNGYSDKR